MERELITRDLLAAALRYLRTARGLTQKDVARRAAVYRDQGFGRLLESQISDFERGRALPSLGSLLNFLAACSDSGSQVSFVKLQRAIETVGAEDGDGPPPANEVAVEGTRAMVDEVVSELSERLRSAMERQKDEMAALRTRVVRAERLLGSLVRTARPGADAS